MSAAAIIIRKRKKIINAFRMAGATDRKHAVSLETLGIRRTWILDQMLKNGSFEETDNHRFFMNEAVALEFMHSRRVRALILAGIFFLVFIIVCLTQVLK